MIKLYSYWRSSAAYRVRIGLNLKAIEHEIVPVNMLKDGGEQHTEDYRRLNPQGLVPTLVDGDTVLGQSLAILEYLDEKYPQVALLPTQTQARAAVRQLALLVACDIHPLNNLRVLKYLTGELQVSEDAKDSWYRHWIVSGFAALETALVNANPGGPYCFGPAVTLADLCLIPQIYNAHRFNIDLQPYPRLCAIEAACLRLAAFERARPEVQIDAV